MRDVPHHFVKRHIVLPFASDLCLSRRKAFPFRSSLMFRSFFVHSNWGRGLPLFETALGCGEGQGPVWGQSDRFLNFLQWLERAATGRSGRKFVWTLMQMHRKSGVSPKSQMLRVVRRSAVELCSGGCDFNQFHVAPQSAFA